MDKSMVFSQACTDLVAESERFEPNPYVDPGSGGVPYTIGYGTTIYCDGTKVTMQDSPISKEDALDALTCHLNKVVLPCIQSHITSSINQNQLDALGSFVYNVGCGNFSASTLLRRINNDPDDTMIPNAFSMWNKADGKVLPGLVTRRKKESALYFSKTI